MVWEELRDFLEWSSKRLFGLGESVEIKARPLKPEEAIGKPKERDFPLVKGRERMMEASVKNFRGHAFTDMFGDFKGTLEDVVKLPLRTNYERAVFISTLNAVARCYFGPIGTVHCVNQEPSMCGKRLRDFFRGVEKIGLFGFQPRFAENLAESFQVRAVDMDEENIGKEKFGVTIEGPEATDDVLSWCQAALVTGTSFTNDTFHPFLEASRDMRVVFYGVTVSGAAKVLHLERFCPYGR